MSMDNRRRRGVSRLNGTWGGGQDGEHAHHQSRHEPAGPGNDLLREDELEPGGHEDDERDRPATVADGGAAPGGQGVLGAQAHSIVGLTTPSTHRRP